MVLFTELGKEHSILLRGVELRASFGHVNVCGAFQTSKWRCQVGGWMYIRDCSSGEKSDQEMTIWESSTYR